MSHRSAAPGPPSSSTEVPGLWAVVPAGGAGTRLWPLSRVAEPKFLADLTGSGRSLLQQTWDRLAALVDDRFLVVTGAAHHAAVAAQLPLLRADAVLVEPSPRDSMAAIGLAAALVERRDPDGVVGSFAADHVITGPDLFSAAVSTATEAARRDLLVTIGIEPTRPSTAFGYIRRAEPLDDLPDAYRVAEFVEKPSEEVARDYVESGRYRWNAGMFVARPTVLLDLLATWHPEFAETLRTIAADPGRIGELWPRLPRIALDHAVAEPAAAAGRVATVAGRFGWDDVGDYDSVAGLLDEDAGRPRVLGDPEQVYAVDSTGLVVPGGDRLLAVVGMDDVVVVDTPDAVLVTRRDQAQRVKQVVEGLRERGRDDLL